MNRSDASDRPAAQAPAMASLPSVRPPLDATLPPVPPVPELPDGRLVGRLALAQAVRNGLAEAARAAWPTLVLSDASFERWPLGEREVIDSLQTWARRSQKMVVIAREYDTVHRLHPRFVQWRRTWAHLLACRLCRRADPLELPSALWSPHWFLLQLDHDRAVSIAGSDEERINALRLRLDEWGLRSTPGFAASVLGL